MEITEKKYITLHANINHPETLKVMEATITSKGCNLFIDKGEYKYSGIENIVKFLNECLVKMG